MLKKIFSLLIFCGCLGLFPKADAEEKSEQVITEEKIVASADKDQNSIEIDPDLMSKLPKYTWEDFLTNRDCRPLIKKLASLPQYNKLYQSLRVSCLEEKPLAWDYLLNVFRKEKRKLLINQILSSNSSYSRIFKLIPHLLFDIQNTKSVGDQPMAVLDKVEQAIIDHQMVTALALISGLPNSWKNQLKNTQFFTKQLLELKTQLNQFNSLNKGGQND